MKNVLPYFRLIRSTNLLIIILTQYFFRHFIILPLYARENILPPTSELYFFFLVLSTVLIAAAGYAINDYFDMRVDRINKPEKMVLGKIIPRRMAILIHGVFTGLGILFSFIAAYMIGSWKLGLFSVVIAFTLWQYSHKFKASFITGNFIIALFSAFVIFIVWLFEYYAQIKSGFPLFNEKFFFNIFMLTYMCFAFLTSFIREVVKDIEDIEGDRRVGCHTIPIKLGVEKAKYITYSIIALSILFLSIFILIIFMKTTLALVGYYMIMLLILFLYLFSMIYKAKDKSDFSFASMYIKIIMFAGILIMQLIYILIK